MTSSTNGYLPRHIRLPLSLGGTYSCHIPLRVGDWVGLIGGLQSPISLLTIDMIDAISRFSHRF